jgi:hypothetical protein
MSGIECHRRKDALGNFQHLFDVGGRPYFFSRMTASISKAISMNRSDFVGGMFKV